MKKSFFTILAIATISINLYAQNIGIGTNNPNASAALEIKASNKGILIPRTSTSSRTAIVNPAKGLLVYDSTARSFWYFDPGLTGGWEQVATGNIHDNWSLSGNAGTNPGINFIGTTDASPLVFKINNINAGIIDTTANNSAIGFRTLDSVTNGTHNSAFGYKALISNNEGVQNTAIGSNALRKNTSGFYNTAAGMQSLTSNTDGFSNTGMGNASLFSNTSGSNNTAIGTGALFSNTIADNNTSIGYQSLNINSTGNSNVAIGVRALHLNATRSKLVAIGDSALFNNGNGVVTVEDASQNTAVGSKSLFSNTAGSYNTGNGFNTLYSNTTGSRNTATGNEALFSNYDGYSNTANGFASLNHNTSGHDNTAIGNSALFSNLTGFNNTATGNAALLNNESGNYNTATGNIALISNKNGYYNTSNGNYSLSQNTEGSFNSAFGNNALQVNNTGSNNTAVGNFALVNNVGGSFNTAIGDHATVETGMLTNATAIGANAVVSASNSLVLGNNANVGIGTPTPDFKLDIQSSTNTFVQIKASQWCGVILDKGTPTENNYVLYRTTGSERWTLGTKGSDNFSLYNWAKGLYGISVDFSNNNVGMGTSAPAAKLHLQSPNIVNLPTGDIVMARYWPANNDTRASSMFHYFNSGNGSDNLAFAVSGEGGNNTQPNSIGQIKMNIQASGRVGIGTINPSEKLEVTGLINAFGYRCRPGTANNAGTSSFNINWTGTAAQLWIDVTNIGTFSYTSDRRLKDQIKVMDDDALKKMLALKPVRFHYKKIEGTVFEGSPMMQEGFIADELQQVIPSAVNGEKNAMTSKGTIQPQTINIIPVVAVLTKAVQEQQAIIEEQQKKLGLQQQQIDMLLKEMQLVKEKIK